MAIGLEPKIPTGRVRIQHPEWPALASTFVDIEDIGDIHAAPRPFESKADSAPRVLATWEVHDSRPSEP